MTAHTELLHRASPADGHSPRVVLTAVLATLKTWHDRAVQRRALAHLTAEMLQDLGIGSIEADREARKPFWVA